MRRSLLLPVLALAMAGVVGFLLWVGAKEGSHRDGPPPPAVDGKEKAWSHLESGVPDEHDEPNQVLPATHPSTTSRASVRGSLEGTVKWPDGQSVDVAFLNLKPLDENEGEQMSKGSGADRWREAGAALNGKFRVEGLGGGRYQFVVARQFDSPKEEQAPPIIGVGWWIASTEVSVPHDGPLGFTLGPMETVHGRVTDLNGRGLSLEGFRIEAVPVRLASEAIDLPPWMRHEWEFNSRFNSEGGGSFEFAGLQPGEWSVSVEAGEFAKSAPRRIRLPRKDPIEFALDRLVELTGRIEDSNGDPHRGVARAKWAECGDAIAAGTTSDSAWGNGLFHLRVPATNVELQAAVEGLAGEVLSLDLAGHRSRENLRLVVPMKSDR
jgi:hypothetical protein